MADSNKGIDGGGLKSCPFCGGKAKMQHIGNEFTKKRSIEISCMTVGCTVKYTVGAIQFNFDWIEHQITKAWNERIYQTDKDAANPILEGQEKYRKCTWCSGEGELKIERFSHRYEETLIWDEKCSPCNGTGEIVEPILFSEVEWELHEQPIYEERAITDTPSMKILETIQNKTWNLLPELSKLGWKVRSVKP